MSNSANPIVMLGHVDIIGGNAIGQSILTTNFSENAPPAIGLFEVRGSKSALFLAHVLSAGRGKTRTGVRK